MSGSELKETKSIGIPRALLYYKYGVLWKEFFHELGFDVVVSPKTDQAIFDAGEARSVDECCLASKIFLGHVDWLVGRCDTIFIPGYASCDARAGFCTKYQSLFDLARNTFRNEDVHFCSMLIEHATKKNKARAAYIDLAERLGVSARKAARAMKRAEKRYLEFNAKKAKTQAESFKLLEKYRKVLKDDTSGSEAVPFAILVVAHPYIGHDEFISGDVIRAIQDNGGVVIFADESDAAQSYKRSFAFSETLPWLINRELVGSLLMNHERIDGVVIISAFPCGPDSMFSEALLRNIKGTPMLNLLIDGMSGSAGMQTRVESFMDILRYHGKGGYLHG